MCDMSAFRKYIIYQDHKIILNLKKTIFSTKIGKIDF
jgi:hypothetical protein